MGCLFAAYIHTIAAAFKIWFWVLKSDLLNFPM